MSLKKVGQVKADKGFRIWDAVIYGAVALLVAVLFIVIFTTRDTSPLKGISISVAGETVYEYDFEKGEANGKSDFVETVSENEKTIIIKISVAGGYNVVEIEKSGKVRVTEADCGKKDCVYTPVLKDNSGVIYCSPHKLKIVPYDFDLDDGNIII